MSIKLVCLDLAGTTVRDDGAVTNAFADALAEAGLEPGTPAYNHGMEYADATMGQSKIEVFQAVLDNEQRAQLANDRFEKSYASGLAEARALPVAGAEETIRSLRAGGVRVALTTGFSSTTCDALLEALGWTELADLVLSPANVRRGRPYPDMALYALLRLRIDSVQDVAVVGDTTNDLLAGSRAGAAIVAGVLTGAHGVDDFAEVPHTHVLDSVADLPSIVHAHHL